MAVSKDQIAKMIEAMKRQESPEVFWNKVEVALELLGACDFDAQNALAALETAIDFYQRTSGQKK